MGRSSRVSNKAALAMVFRLVEGAQKSWRRVDGHNQLPKLVLGVKFKRRNRSSLSQPTVNPEPRLRRHQNLAIALDTFASNVGHDVAGVSEDSRYPAPCVNAGASRLRAGILGLDQASRQSAGLVARKAMIPTSFDFGKSSRSTLSRLGYMPAPVLIAQHHLPRHAGSPRRRRLTPDSRALSPERPCSLSNGG